MVYAYTRVSTELQTLENQEYGIKKWCESREISVDAWIEEKASGKKIAKERELGKLLKLIKKGDWLICTEISRIGRFVPDILQTIKNIRDKGATLVAIKQNFILDDSLNSKIMSYVFSIVAEIERELLSMRVKEGLASRKAKGIKLGRPLGSKNKASKLDSKRDFILLCLEAGKSLNWIKNALKCHRSTLDKWIEINKTFVAKGQKKA